MGAVYRVYRVRVCDLWATGRTSGSARSPEKPRKPKTRTLVATTSHQLPKTPMKEVRVYGGLRVYCVDGQGFEV